MVKLSLINYSLNTALPVGTSADPHIVFYTWLLTLPKCRSKPHLRNNTLHVAY